MTLEETLSKVDDIVESYDDESQLSMVTKTHQVMSEHIKELEGALECALKTVDRLDDADLGSGDNNYCCECNAQDNINMLNGEYLCAECIEAGGLGE